MVLEITYKNIKGWHTLFSVFVGVTDAYHYCIPVVAYIGGVHFSQCLWEL